MVFDAEASSYVADFVCLSKSCSVEDVKSSIQDTISNRSKLRNDPRSLPDSILQVTLLEVLSLTRAVYGFGSVP